MTRINEKPYHAIYYFYIYGSSSLHYIKSRNMSNCLYIYIYFKILNHPSNFIVKVCPYQKVVGEQMLKLCKYIQFFMGHMGNIHKHHSISHIITLIYFPPFYYLSRTLAQLTYNSYQASYIIFYNNVIKLDLMSC